MSYGTKYIATWGSRKGLSGNLYIKELDYTGDATTILLKGFDKGALAIEQKFNDWESPILGRVLSFTIVNSFEDFYFLLPLLTATERQFLVELDVTNPSNEAKLLFKGYLNTGQTSQKMLPKQDIHLVASTYLSKLDNYTTDLVNTWQVLFFVNLINGILSSIGQYNLRINSSLWTVADPGAGKTLFNTTGINTEVFWEDNITKKNNLEILRMILISFNCFIYWKEGYWYIERFDDLWNTNPTYVEYAFDTVYDSTMSGTVVSLSRSLIDIQTLKFMNTSQTLHVNPGYKTIKINVNTDKHLLFNLIDPFFPDNADDIPDVDANTIPLPVSKEWEKAEKFSWSIPSHKYGMTSSISRQGIGADDSHDYYQGLYTRFRVAIADVDTTLDIEFTYYGYIPGDINGTNVSPDFTNYFFKFNWWLKEADNDYYIVENESDGSYQRVQNTNGADRTSVLNSTSKVSFTSFDKDTRTYKMSVGVTIGGIYDIDTIHDLVLGIGVPTLLNGDTEISYVPMTNPPQGHKVGREQFGDVKITVNNPIDSIDNEIEGTTNTLFLNKKEIDIDIADISNINYTNGILTGSDLSLRTSKWSKGDSVFRPLVDWLMIDKFRLYNVSRQRIKGTIFRDRNLEVFDLFTDSNQPDKKFILVGYTYHPVFDSYDIDLWEFDVDTVINLLG